MSMKVCGKSQRGALSLEMVIVLMIVLVLVGWALSRSQMMQSRAGSVSEGSNTVTLIESVRGLLKSSGTYGASGTNLVSSLITANGVPGDMTISSGKIYNAFGGEVTIVSTGSGFTVTSPSLPPDICMQAAIKVSGAENGITTSLNSGAGISGAVSSSAAASGCNQTGNANTIAYTSAS